MNDLGTRIRELREKNKLSQISLAKKLNVSDACVNRWEKGLRTPSVSNIMVLCELFSVTSDYLLGITDKD